MNYQYEAYGISISSELELPELPKITADDPDLVISFGKVPSQLENPVAKNLLVQSSPNEFLLTYKEVANYYATNGNSVVIQRGSNSDDEKIKLYLMGTVLTAILHQRNFWPIHASGIEIKGSCFAFSGISGAGKSTTASQFAKRGYKILADDVCAVTLNDGIPVVQSGYPQLRLWKDSVKMIGADHNELKPVRNELFKYGYPVSENFTDKPTPLKRIYMLQRHNKDEIEIEVVKGASKFQRMLNSTHKADLTKGQGNQKLQFNVCGAAAKHVDVRVIRHSYRHDHINEFIDRIEEDIYK